MRRWLCLACGLTLGAALLSGCQGGGDPSPSPSVSPPVSESVSPTESSSPPAEETPEAFIERWIAASNEMFATGKTQAYRRLSRPCDACNAVADDVARIYREGGEIETEGWSVISVKRTGGSGRVVVIEVLIDNAATNYTETSGGPTKTLPAGKPLMQFTLRRAPDGFVVVDLAERPQ